MEERIVLRTPVELKELAKQAAARDSRTLTSYIINLIKRDLDKGRHAA